VADIPVLVVEGDLAVSYMSESLAKSLDCFWINENDFLNRFFNIKTMSKIYKFPFHAFKGKGIAHIIARVIMKAFNLSYIVMIDADLQNIEELDPLRLLIGSMMSFESSGQNPEHIVLATPNRKNDGLHATIENMLQNALISDLKEALKKKNIQKIYKRIIDIIPYRNDKQRVVSAIKDLPEFSKNIAKIYLYLTPIVHLLAGERVLSQNLIKKLPCINNSLETIINLTASILDIPTYQVGHKKLRLDYPNSYEKNEILLIACQRLIQCFLNYKSLLEWNENDYRFFNVLNTTLSQIHILPQEWNKPVFSISANLDFIIPSLDVLCDKGLIEIPSINLLKNILNIH